ncbi:type II secretion system protein GspG [Carboxylicivirga marina]|uniref:Type II secretion system protein GspG n=1 Tax=Carboxylicivirga marina TaxID=2800988 RepID=A0ABS1HQD7_9BACT|nr:type II secretion system protein GspG [Carboxylicivirga marina]MBK3519888.1 type II secretion system protein GspG [Carboxylicivirga marina]
MLAIILSIILPGLGQLYYGKVFKGLVMIFLTFVPFIYPFVLIWSIYDCVQLRKKVSIDPITQKETALALVIGFIIVPIVAIGLYTGVSVVGNKISNQYLKKNYTLTEMKKMQLDLEKTLHKNGSYPENLSELVGHKPLNETLYTDAWGNMYHYEKKDDNSYKLMSNGVDGISGTNDDIVLSN